MDNSTWIENALSRVAESLNSAELEVPESVLEALKSKMAGDLQGSLKPGEIRQIVFELASKNSAAR